jgi:hypothetical protein
MAVVMANSLGEAQQKLLLACDNSVARTQGSAVSFGEWSFEHVVLHDVNDNDGLGPRQIDGDVAFTYGVDG